MMVEVTKVSSQMGRRKYVAVLALISGIGSPKAAEMVFTDHTSGNCVKCQWVSAEGEITKDTYKKLLEFSGGKLTPTIYFDSPGGSLIGGIQLGETIRKLGLATGIGRTVPPSIEGLSELKQGACLSACAFAYMGGVYRFLEYGSQFGVHQFYDASTLVHPTEKVFTAIDVSNDQLITGLILEYTVRMGVDARVIALASKTNPTDMYILTADEAADMKVSWNPAEMKSWQIKPYKNGLVTFTKSQNEQSSLTLYCENGKRFLLYTVVAIDGSSYLPSVAPESGAFNVLGAIVPRNLITGQKSQTTSATQFSLPNNFTPKITPGLNLISNRESTPHVGWFEIEFQSNGLQDGARLAFKNCV